jgi:predicted RNA binding protein YcfA (HicA-like mRNA interferase family)
MARILERRGWILKRVQGSHHIYCKSGNVARISLPIHGNASLKKGLQLHIMKLAGMSEMDL